MPAISIENLGLFFGARPIIQNFSASINAGEFIGIFGPNGAGKSSLLRMILGLISPNTGTLRVFDQTPQRGNIEIGYMPQSLKTIHTSRLSGRSRVRAFYNGFKWGLPFVNKKQAQEIDHVIEVVGAQDFANRPFSELSGGEQQRFLLAQALLSRPKILLLDEPLTNLDPNYQEKLVQAVQNIQKQLHVTILFTAHDLNPLLGAMDRIIYLARGNAAIGTVSEIVTNEKLSWLYGTPMEVLHYQQRLFVINKEHGGISSDEPYHHTAF